MPNDQRRIAVALERIAESLEKIAERRDADNNLIPEDRCKRCGLPDWDCECYADDYSGPYACPQCGKVEGEYHHDCPNYTDAEMVEVPPVRDSFPLVSTERGGLRSPAGPRLGSIVPPGERGPTFFPTEPVTPGAPPPERPDGIQFDPVPQPTFRAGDTITVVEPDGQRRDFVIKEDVAVVQRAPVPPFLSRDGGHVVGPDYNTEIDYGPAVDKHPGTA